MQRKLIATGNGLDESDPDLLGYGRPRFVLAIEQIAEGRLTVIPVLVWLSFRNHRSASCRR
jgi:hypothetical protein